MDEIVRINSDLPPIRRLPLAGRAGEVYDGILKAVLDHRLMPGTKLSEDEVGAVFGVSRTVVRAALQALAFEGIVEIFPNRGAFVAKPSTKTAKQVFEARALIEPELAAKAAVRMSPEELDGLRHHIEREHAALHAENQGEAIALSGAFHIRIAELSGQAVLTGFVRELISQSSLIVALYWTRRETTCDSDDHGALMEAFSAGDGGAARSVMREHIERLRDGLDLTDRETRSVSIAEALGRVTA